MADYTVIKGLVTSNGDTGRDSIALDTATQLTATDVKHFKDYGFSIVGRYLTGTVGSNFVPKNLTTTEVKTIIDGGMGDFFRSMKMVDMSRITLLLVRASKMVERLFQRHYNLVCQQGQLFILQLMLIFKKGISRNGLFHISMQCKNILSGSIYKTGIYGTRNVCLHAEKSGINYSFVANMSLWMGGNLGFKMPDNWSFDQFVEYPIYGIDIDQGASSGRDKGVSHVNSSVKRIKYRVL